MADHLMAQQRALLETWGALYARLEERLMNMSDDDLGNLYEAMRATSQTNCWYAVYAASQAMMPIIAKECGRRTVKKLKTMDRTEQKE